MLIGGFVTCIVLTLSPHASKAGERAPVPPKAAEAHAPARSEDVYSLRARRRFAAYLRLRLLELREAGLERAAEAVQRRLPADALVK